YRPFDASEMVNDVEVFSGVRNMELLAYTFEGAASDIGAGTQLGVELRDDSGLACDCEDNFEDCAGTCGGSATDVGCGCGEAGPSGCDNACGSTAVVDCAGTCGGSAEVLTYWNDDDDDGLGNGASQNFCDATVPSGWVLNNADADDSIFCYSNLIDACGVCDGDGSDDLGCGCFEAGPSGCDNACGSTLVVDECGDCGGSGIPANNSIRARTDYRASSGFGIGDMTTVYAGREGYVLANPFQMNLEHGPDVDNDAV
ncbi:uncharacterized protein METZ01_LOCUS450842, partial [marine metagenome]